MRRTLGLNNGTANAFIRGELGLCSLQSHRDELVLRFFARLCNTSPHRLVGHVFREKMEQARRGLTERGWCVSVRQVQKYDMDDVWQTGEILRTGRLIVG